MGEGGVGKTTLCNRVLTGIFNPATKMTIGVDFQLLKVDILDPTSEELAKVSLEVQLWDLGGQEQFRFMHPRFVKGAVGGLLCYDLSRISTKFKLDKWMEIWKENSEPNTPLILIGTKMDLINKGAQNLAVQEIKSVAEEYNIEKTFLISSQSGLSVDILMDTLLKDSYAFNVKKFL